ncbi:hypothetical protein RZS08_42275, partial [Arthrospira platensis SPKY1]|nr:hypothetical protein [Arthrospira platensis SPKY1]
MIGALKRLFGSKYDRDIKEYLPIVEKINSLCDSYSSLSHDELRNKSLEFRQRISEYLSETDEEIRI